MKILTPLLLLISITLFTACVQDKRENTSQAAPESSNALQTAYITQDTEYYRSFPAQASPADGVVRRGTQVTVKANAGSYSLVIIPNNIEAYVASNALRLDSK